MPRFLWRSSCDLPFLTLPYTLRHTTHATRVRMRGLTSHRGFFLSLPTVMPGLYGHSCSAESYAVILVGLNEMAAGNLKSASATRPRARRRTRGVGIRQPPAGKTARGRKTPSARGLDRLQSSLR